MPGRRHGRCRTLGRRAPHPRHSSRSQPAVTSSSGPSGPTSCCASRTPRTGGSAPGPTPRRGSSPRSTCSSPTTTARHKSTHTATAVDAAANTAVASIRVAASAAGYRQLLGWAQQFAERCWAVENARGLGCHLAQWLVAHGETVLDASTAATARVRELSRGGQSALTWSWRPRVSSANGSSAVVWKSRVARASPELAEPHPADCHTTPRRTRTLSKASILLVRVARLRCRGLRGLGRSLGSASRMGQLTRRRDSKETDG